MLVKCLYNDIRSVDPATELGLELGRTFGSDTHSLSLSVGELYVVYAVEISNGWIRYFVADDHYSSTLYPVANFASLFEVVDRRVSRCWMVRPNVVSRSPQVLLAFEAWSLDPLFYERLVDGFDAEQRLFRKRKELMDLEFPNPSVVAAEVLGEDWLLCPKCSDYWESRTVEGMLRCPNCIALLSNPLFASAIAWLEFHSG